ncbi:MAG: SusC/RagA family TonB-linked outer membrane protein [Muribaculaceae bacterium]|nr:SusC/RagA family TonB-linked outer membrane protein [Muribaculaceae bacterium]
MRKLFFILMAVLASTLSVMAQNRTYHGTVVDAANDEPLIGATVTPIGGGQGVATDIEGKFVLSVPANVKQIKVSYVGYTAGTATLKDNMVVRLSSTSENLDDLVVVAYGTQKKSSITGAISTVDAATIEKRPISSVTSALEGTTPGITTTANYGAPGESSTVQIRGIGTVNGSNTPLIVVDGVPYPGSISEINPEDVQSMSVLKDAASAALYGNRAANGVILITTKKSKSDRTQINFKTTQGWYNRAIKDYKTTNTNQWMNAAFQDMLSTYVNTQGVSRDDVSGMSGARDYVRQNFVDGYSYINIFDASNTSLFDANGNFVNASIQGGYEDDLDWFDAAERTGYRGEYYLSASGATEKSDYFFSLGYLSEDGYMRDSDFRRINGRAAINVQPVKWIKTGLTMSVSNSKQSSSLNGIGDGNNSNNNPFLSCRVVAPIYAVHQHNPFTGEYILDGNGNKLYNLGYVKDVELYNPATGNNEYIDYLQVNNRTLERNVVYESVANSDKTVKNTMNSTAYVDVLIPYGFTFTLKGNLATRNSENTFMGSAEIGDYVSKNGQLNKTIYNYKNWTFMQNLRWNQSYGDHYIEVLLGHENYSYMYDYTYNSKTNEAFTNIPALSNYSEMTSVSGYKRRYRTESYLARVQYGFDNRYNFEASFRRDASSRFAKKSRWGNFGSVGANWVFTNEDFMREHTWITNGKLRGDWGLVGQDAGAGYYESYALYTSTTQNSQSAYYISSNAATDLKWETGESWGIGIEGRLFNRWNLSVEYYNKLNKDLLFNVYAPVSQGSTATTNTASNSSFYSVTMKNMGTIANRGIEINTSVDIFNNKDWDINLAANLSTLKNKVISLPEQNKDGIDNTTQYIAEGKSRYEFYTRTFRGVDLATGQSLYDLDFNKYHIVATDGQIIGGTKDATGAYTSEATNKYVYINGKYYSTDYTQAERTFKGHAMPSVYGSFTPTIRWKDFNFSMMVYYSLGGQVYDSPYASLMSASGAPRNFHEDILNSWIEIPSFLLNADGSVNLDYTGADRISTSINPEISSATSAHNNAASDRWLLSADYWQIKNINVSYTIPRKITSRWGMDIVRLSFAAENVYTHTKRQGINPMMAMSGYLYNYAVPARVFTFGINVNL